MTPDFGKLNSMARNEFDKVFLDIDYAYKLEGNLFGKEWDEVRFQQFIFLINRPLLFKVQTQKVWGPARLDGHSVGEWWEVEEQSRKSDRPKQIEELSDMALLSLTLDSLNPDLSLPSQKELLRIAWMGTVESYCQDLGLNKDELVSTVAKKIEINEIRNPMEAFQLVATEDIQVSIKRMEHNWVSLKKKRNEPAGFLDLFNKRNWWKKWFYIDEIGYVREKIHE